MEQTKKEKLSARAIIINLIIIIIGFVIVWHTAVYVTMNSFKCVLDFARQSIKDYVLAEYNEADLNKKLVVLTQPVNVTIHKNKDNRILWDFMSVGSANMTVKFIDNKVQYYVPLKELRDSDFVYDFETKTIKISVPSVRIDKDMVFIQSNPDKIIKEENGSWSPFGPSIKDMNDDIMREIKEETLIVGFRKEIRDKAQEEARKAVEELFNKILADFLRKEGLKLQVMMP